jgi:putative oxidoreductase
MNQHTLSRIAVGLLGIVLIVFGIFHFTRPDDLVNFVPNWVPGGRIWVSITGLAFVAAGLSFLTNKLVKYSGYALAILLFIFVVTIHLPNAMSSGSAELRNAAMVSLLKDIALSAFALYIASNADFRKHLTQDD